MTAGVVLPVVPPTARFPRPAGSNGPRRPLPLPPTPSSAPARPPVFGLATLDCNGRLADGALVAALGWGVQTRLDIRVRAGLVLIQPDPHAVFRLTRSGHVRLPANVRDWCALATGDRVLLIADLEAGLLVLHPPAALTTMVSQFHAAMLGGGAE
jgi:hypothetical protein